MANFDLEDEELTAPEGLKGQLTTEMDFIRDVLTITDFFSSNFARTAVSMLSDTNQKPTIE